MARFSYQAYDAAGARINGNIDASDQAHALKQLKAEGLLVSDLKPLRNTNHVRLFSRSTVSLADIEFLTAELSLLLASGVRIDKGLDIIHKTKANPALAKLIGDLSSSIKKGHNLSQAVAEHPKVFDSLYCNLIQLGEASGNLSEVFAELAKDLKFRRDLQRKIVSSMTYPAVILLVCMVSVVFIFNFIIPKMATLFTDLDAVPWYTRMMIQTSEWMTRYQGFLAVGMLLSVALVVAAFKRPEVKHWWHEIVLKLPVLKSVVSLTERIRFSSSMTMMLKSGLAVDKAMELAVGNVKNHLLVRELNIARKKIKQGTSFTMALSQSTLFPDFFVSLLDIGEQSGNLERIFEEITQRSRQEFESWTERMTTLIEPLLILFMGTFVGGVVVVMLLSMVSMNEIGV